MKVPSRAGALQFSSWNRADNTDNMSAESMSQLATLLLYYEVVMSPSRKFPARAEPSYEGAEPSWGTLISELKPSWIFFDISNSKVFGTQKKIY